MKVEAVKCDSCGELINEKTETLKVEGAVAYKGSEVLSGDYCVPCFFKLIGFRIVSK